MKKNRDHSMFLIYSLYCYGMLFFVVAKERCEMEKSILQRTVEKERFICLGFCLVALVAFLLPAIRLEITIFESSTYTFSMASLFNRSGSGSDVFDLSEMLGGDFFDVAAQDHPLAAIGIRLMMAVGGYFLAAILLLATFLFICVGKFKKMTVILPLIAFAVLSFSGYTVLGITEAVQSGLESLLGFWAAFIDVSNMMSISLGFGFWSALIAIGGLLIFRIGLRFFQN